MSKLKDYTNTKCCRCGGNETYIMQNGRPRWHGHSCNRNDCAGYICHECYKELSRIKTKKIKEEMVKSRSCCICDSRDTYKDGSGKANWYVCSCGESDCTKYMCSHCYTTVYFSIPENRYRNYPSNWRTGNLSRYCPSGKGFIGAQIIAKTLDLDDCNIKMDKFNFYIDLSKHSKYGYVEVKTSSLNNKTRYWKFTIKIGQEFGTLILVCMDDNKPWKDVVRIYAIPYDELYGLTGLSVSSISKSKWDKFRTDEKPFNDTYHKMDIKKCKVLRKDE